jgi:hypothetical protein
VTSLRLTPALVASIVAALVSWWICYAVVASVTRSSPRPAASVRQPGRTAASAAGTTVTLSPVSALHVRSTLLDRTPASQRAPAIRLAAPSTPAPAMSTPASPPATPTPVPADPTPPATPPQSAPAPQSARAPRPTITAAPKQAPAPDFDESQPSGFDTSG